MYRGHPQSIFAFGIEALALLLLSGAIEVSARSDLKPGLSETGTHPSIKVTAARRRVDNMGELGLDPLLPASQFGQTFATKIEDWPSDPLASTIRGQFLTRSDQVYIVSGADPLADTGRTQLEPLQVRALFAQRVNTEDLPEQAALADKIIAAVTFGGVMTRGKYFPRFLVATGDRQDCEILILEPSLNEVFDDYSIVPVLRSSRHVRGVAFFPSPDTSLGQLTLLVEGQDGSEELTIVELTLVYDSTA